MFRGDWVRLVRVASPNLRETVFEHSFDSSDLHYDLSEVHVWLADLSAWQDPDISCLDEEERSRSARFRFDADRGRYERSHAFLRHVLAQYTGTDPGVLVFKSAEHGKPFLLRGPRFNLSHAGERAAVAVAAREEVGVDIESTVRRVDPEEILTRFFHPADLAAWRATPRAERVDRFFEAWTRQEAVLKALGTGIAGGLGRSPVLNPRAGAPWRLYPIEAGPGYKATLAVL